jgi:hypothetical protein
MQKRREDACALRKSRVGGTKHNGVSVAFRTHPERPDYRGISGKPDYVRKACDASLRRLRLDLLDLYYHLRVYPDTLGALLFIINSVSYGLPNPQRWRMNVVSPWPQ